MLINLLIIIFLKCSESAKILGFFPAPSHSHQRIFQPIIQDLSLRGHEVTVISPNTLNDPSLVNLTEIDVRFGYKILEEEKLIENISSEKAALVCIWNLFSIIQKVMESYLNQGVIQKLINNETNKFDIIIVQSTHIFPWYMVSEQDSPHRLLVSNTQSS
ncbi:hypothetical protein JTB14_031311 [Gonioctena quinquepunctata]|nr:hypothetical protein JTB14_031311 [Gonioctena quinquepunctata]